MRSIISLLLCGTTLAGCTTSQPRQAASSQTFYLDASGKIRATQPTASSIPPSVKPLAKQHSPGNAWGSFWDWFTDMDAFDRNLGRMAAMQSIMASQATIQNSIRSSCPRTYTVTPQPFGTYQITGGY